MRLAWQAFSLMRAAIFCGSLPEEDISVHTAMLHAIAFFAFALTPSQQEQVQKLEHTLMAPCCYSQTIDEHMSQEAADMRAEVEQMVENGKSDREILTFYRKKYGETILASPDGLSGTLLAVVPILLCSVSCLFLVLLIRGWNRRQGTVGRAAAREITIPHGDELVRRIRAEIGEF